MIAPLLAVLLLAPGCRSAGTIGPGGGPIQGGPPDLDRIFAAATADEIQAVTAEWASRQPMAAGVEIELSQRIIGGARGLSFHVVSHLVDDHRHYGAVLLPPDRPPGSLPVIVYAHGGDGGTSLAELLIVRLMLGDLGSRAILVAPAFRSEALDVGVRRFVSEGPPSPWDRDVDDTIALLNAVLERFPEANPDRVVALGQSRGGGVALLMAARDPRIRAVSKFFGPTDFFDDYVRVILEQALEGRHRDLPGFDVLNHAFIQPLRTGQLAVEQFRIELVRRSPVLFVDRLPPIQLHHGTADDIVHVSQTYALQDALERSDRRRAGQDEVYIYPGAGHSLTVMVLALGRVVTFLDRHLGS